MGGTASRETPQSRPAPAAADTLAKKRLASPETFVRVLTSNDAYSAILAYSGFERVLTVETLSHAARRASRAAELLLDTTEIFEARPFDVERVRRVMMVADRDRLCRARRSGLLGPRPLVVTKTFFRGYYWELHPSVPWTPSDAVYPPEGGARLLSPCGRQSAALGDGTAVLDAPRAAASLAAIKRARLGLLGHGKMTIFVDPDPTDARARKLGKRYFQRLSNAGMLIPRRSWRVDEADAAALVRSMGGPSAPRALRDAAALWHGHDHGGQSLGPERYDAMLARSASSASSVDAALLRRVVDAAAWNNLRREAERGRVYNHRLTEQDFEAACRDAGAPRWREIWAEALDGLLLPFEPEYYKGVEGNVGVVDTIRCAGDVRPGDVASVNIEEFPLLAAASSAITSRCGGDPAVCFGAELENVVFKKRHGGQGVFSLAIGVLKDLEARRDGEADGSAGQRRLETACQAVLARHVPLKGGDDVEVYAKPEQGALNPINGTWKQAKILLPERLSSGYHGLCTVQIGDEESSILLGEVRKAGAQSAATALLVAAVEHSRNDVVRLLLDLSPDFAAEAVLCPGGSFYNRKQRKTALDVAVDAGNSVALGLLCAKLPFFMMGFSRGSLGSSPFHSIRNNDHLSPNLAPQIRAEFARILVDGFTDDFKPEPELAAVSAAVNGDAGRAWQEIARLVAVGKRAVLFHDIRSFVRKRWRRKQRDATAAAADDEEDSDSDSDSDDDDEVLQESRRRKEAALQDTSTAFKKALYAAARHGQVEVIEALLRFPTMTYGLSLKHVAEYAVTEGHPMCFRFLVRELIARSQSVPRLRRQCGELACLAARLGRSESLQVLLEEGVSLHVATSRDDLGLWNSPLEQAALYGQPDCIVVLLKDPAVRASLRERQSDAIAKACTQGHVASLTLLLDVEGVDAGHVRPWPRITSHTSTMLHAVTSDEVNVVETLIHYGVDVNFSVPEYKTPLGMAAIQGYIDIAERLLDAGATVRRQDGDHLFSAYTLACMNFYCSWKGYEEAGEDMLKLLLAERPDDCSPSGPGNPLCEVVAYAGNEEMCRVLLDAGADVSASVEESGVTALHIAVYCAVTHASNLVISARMVPIIRFLVARGADLDARTRCQPTPRHIYEHLDDYASGGDGIPVGATPRDIAAVCGTAERQDAVAALLAAAVAERALKPA